MTFYKGYMVSNNKIPTKKLTQENFNTKEEIENINPPSYIGILSNEAVLIDFDDTTSSEIALKMIKDNNIKCRVLKSTRGIHVLFKADDYFEFNNTSKQLGCGLIADIKTGKKNGIEALKTNGKERTIIYDTGTYDVAPCWFRPLKYKKEDNIDFINMENGDGRNSTLYSYLIKLVKVMSKEEAKDTIRMLNGYVLKDKLSEGEIRTITRDDAFENIKTETFFTDKGVFLFDNFANYLMKEKKIIKIDSRLYIYKDGVYIDGMEWIEREMIKNISLLTKAKRKEVLEYLKLLIEEDENPTEFTQYIAFRNGIYDITTEKIIPFNDEIIVTNKIDWDYNPYAYSKIVDDMFNKLSCEDPEVRAILEEMIGYCFFRQNELGKSFVLVGPASNGKSTLQGMIEKLLGRKNTVSIDMKDLNDKFRPAKLYGKLANIGDDISDKYIDDNNIFKTVVTGGRIMVENKGQDPFEFDPYTKCIFSSNNIPKTRDKTGAIKRRLIIVPFDRVFSPNDPDFDPYVKYKIINGNEDYPVDDNMSYIINIALAGLKRVIANNGFTHSKRVQLKIDEYDKDNNPIKIWFEELGEDPADEIDMNETQEVYKQYNDFCIENNLKPMSKIEFSKTLKNEFNITSKVARVNGNTTRIYVKEN